MALAENKKALFDYEILEKLEAGLVLRGYETKAAKAGHINLKGAYVTFHGSDALLTNAHIGLYKPAGKIEDYDPTHSRRLLLKKKEIDYLRFKSQEKGLTIVPIRVYTKQRFIKVEVAVARGKKQFDKRDAIKKRDLNKEIKRTLKNYA
ncbi:MAG: SsrA-binding protein SmpB [Candidatus Magasanikbacteria bacterium]|nr:SsrA-binding protein SmpB [Candidatus Magasanikbacteria bacterium]